MKKLALALFLLCLACPQQPKKTEEKTKKLKKIERVVPEKPVPVLERGKEEYKPVPERVERQERDEYGVGRPWEPQPSQPLSPLEKEVEKPDSIDWRYWSPWEFSSGGWKILGNIGIKINKIFVDSLVNRYTLGHRQRERKEYYLVIDASFRSLKEIDTLSPCSFFIKDERNEIVYGYNYSGDLMYLKLNPNAQLKREAYALFPYEELIIGPAREHTLSRKITIAIAKNFPFFTTEEEELREMRYYLKGQLYLGYVEYPKNLIPLTHTEHLGLLKEGWWKLVRRKKMTEEEAVDKVKNLEEVQEFMTGRKIKFIVKEEGPFYIVQVCEEFEDHCSTFGFYRVDSTGNIEKLDIITNEYKPIRPRSKKWSKEEIFAKTIDYVLGLCIREKPDVIVSYRKLDDRSYRSIKRRDSGIDSITHYLKDVVPISENCFKLVFLNYSHYYEDFSPDSAWVYMDDDSIKKIEVLDEDGSFIELEEALKKHK